MEIDYELPYEDPHYLTDGEVLTGVDVNKHNAINPNTLEKYMNCTFYMTYKYNTDEWTQDFVVACRYPYSNAERISTHPSSKLVNPITAGGTLNRSVLNLAMNDDMIDRTINNVMFREEIFATLQDRNRYHGYLVGVEFYSGERSYQDPDGNWFTQHLIGKEQDYIGDERDYSTANYYCPTGFAFSHASDYNRVMKQQFSQSYSYPLNPPKSNVIRLDPNKPNEHVYETIAYDTADDSDDIWITLEEGMFFTPGRSYIINFEVVLDDINPMPSTNKPSNWQGANNNIGLYNDNNDGNSWWLQTYIYTQCNRIQLGFSTDAKPDKVKEFVGDSTTEYNYTDPELDYKNFWVPHAEGIYSGTKGYDYRQVTLKNPIISFDVTRAIPFVHGRQYCRYHYHDGTLPEACTQKSVWGNKYNASYVYTHEGAITNKARVRVINTLLKPDDSLNTNKTVSGATPVQADGQNFDEEHLSKNNVWDTIKDNIAEDMDIIGDVFSKPLQLPEIIWNNFSDVFDAIAGIFGFGKSIHDNPSPPAPMRTALPTKVLYRKEYIKIKYANVTIEAL